MLPKEMTTCAPRKIVEKETSVRRGESAATDRHDHGSFICSLCIPGRQCDNIADQRVDSHCCQVDCEVANSRLAAGIVANQDGVSEDTKDGKGPVTGPVGAVVNPNGLPTTHKVNSDLLEYLSAAKPTKTVMMQAKTCVPQRGQLD
jgi:hypothetical protein